MAKRVSLKGKGADIFFGEYASDERRTRAGKSSRVVQRQRRRASLRGAAAEPCTGAARAHQQSSIVCTADPRGG